MVTISLTKPEMLLISSALSNLNPMHSSITDAVSAISITNKLRKAEKRTSRKVFFTETIDVLENNFKIPKRKPIKKR